MIEITYCNMLRREASFWKVIQNGKAVDTALTKKRAKNIASRVAIPMEEIIVRNSRK